MRKLKQNRGITLVALVITVIILLILAGITISLTIGQRGILNRAQEAGKNYEEAAKKEDEDLANFLGEADNIIAGINIPNSSNEDKYTMVDDVPVPKGFQYKEGTKDTGFVIQDISVDNEGNPTKTNGNEFVWIPCTENGANGSIKYDRYAFSRDGWNFRQTKTGEEIKMTLGGTEYSFTEAKSSVELEINSVKKYGGFYIGRYEVRIEGGIQDLTGYNEANYIAPNKEWTGWKNGKAVVQQNKQVWNYITIDMAKKVAEGMYVNNNAVTSRLCSSYAWDTTLQFIGGDYAVNSAGDNYSGGVNNTGENSIARKGIYDMGGNVSEWTTEVCSDTSSPYTRRGGFYDGVSSDGPASFRYNVSENHAGVGVGFRITLYVGL